VTIRIINANLVEISLNEKIISVKTDDESAVQLAFKLTDWSEYYARMDRSEENTDLIELEKYQ
jgi:hypothetical protein